MTDHKKLLIEKKKSDKIFTIGQDDKPMITIKKTTQPEPCETGKSIFGGERILVEDTVKVKHKSDILPDGEIIGQIVGASGSGKTRILLSIIPLINNLSHVVVCSKIVGGSVYQAIKRWCDANNINYAFASDPIEGSEVVESMVNEKGDDTWGLIVMDDMTRMSASREDIYNKFTSMCFSMLRNYKCHMIMITQNATNIPTLVRTNTSLKICFEMKNVHAIRSFRSDFESATGHPGYVFDELYSAIRNKKHSFILICNDDVYIHIHNPNDNDEGTIEKVEFTHDDQQDNQKYDLDNDQKLLQLIEQINNCKSVSKKFYKQKLIKAMSNYCSSIIEQFNIDPEHLDSFVQSKLD